MSEVGESVTDRGMDIPPDVGLPNDDERDSSGADVGHLAIPGSEVVLLRAVEGALPVDAGVGVPVGPVDFEEAADVGQPEVDHADEAAPVVADGELRDVPNANAPEGPSNQTFQLGNPDDAPATHQPSVIALPIGEVVEGDCVEVMRLFPPDSIDAIVCDPPYGLEFMGREWDKLGDIRQSRTWLHWPTRWTP